MSTRLAFGYFFSLYKRKSGVCGGRSNSMQVCTHIHQVVNILFYNHCNCSIFAPGLCALLLQLLAVRKKNYGDEIGSPFSIIPRYSMYALLLFLHPEEIKYDKIPPGEAKIVKNTTVV